MADTLDKLVPVDVGVTSPLRVLVTVLLAVALTVADADGVVVGFPLRVPVTDGLAVELAVELDTDDLVLETVADVVAVRL